MISKQSVEKSDFCNVLCDYQIVIHMDFLLLCGFQNERDLTHLLPRFLLVTVVVGLTYAGFRAQGNINSVLWLLCCLRASECLASL